MWKKNILFIYVVKNKIEKTLKIEENSVFIVKKTKL